MYRQTKHFLIKYTRKQFAFIGGIELKRFLAMILSLLMICTAAACTSEKNESESEAETTASGTVKTETTAPATTKAVEKVTKAAEATTAAQAAKPQALSSDAEAALNQTIADHGFEGVIYVVKDSAPVFQYANGTLCNGAEINIGTSIPVCSVSKQFCAAAIMILQEDGLLSTDDTLDKYFPEYTEGKKITLKNLMSMRSGIPDFYEENNPGLLSGDKTDAENKAALKNWVFSQPLVAEPDSSFAYTNVNFFLLSQIVEQVSGERYIDFLRKYFFEPLGMTHTGSVVELGSNPEWASGATFPDLGMNPSYANGCADLVSNAEDIIKWITAFGSGRVVNDDSFARMTTSYSEGMGYGYGYGLFTNIDGGIGHPGSLGVYTAYDYINSNDNTEIFLCSNTLPITSINQFMVEVIEDIKR